MFFQNFVTLCNKNGITPNAVCLALGLSPAAATKWRSGAVPRDTTLLKIADYFGITVDDLLRDPTQKVESNAVILDPEKTRMVPVFESVSAGFGVIAQDLILEYMPLYIPSDSEAKDTICIKVKGDSMSPDIEDGDVIQVYKTSDVENGSIAVVLVDGDEALVKKVHFGMASAELRSINPAYPPMTFSGESLSRIQIVGAVRNTIKSSKARHPNSEPFFTKNEAKLIELMRRIPEDRQKLFLEMGEVYAKSLKKD